MPHSLTSRQADERLNALERDGLNIKVIRSEFQLARRSAQQCTTTQLRGALTHLIDMAAAASQLDMHLAEATGHQPDKVTNWRNFLRDTVDEATDEVFDILVNECGCLKPNERR